MKVLQVNKLYYPHIGGVEHVVRDLVLELKDKVDMRVLVANKSTKTSIEIIDGIEVTKIASLGQLKSAPIAPTFGLWMKRLKSDIYHMHVPNPTGELFFLLSRPPGKMVVTYHSDVVRQRMLLRLYGPILDRFLASADRIMPTSQNQIDNSPFLSRVRGKCTVVPLGVSPEQFAPTEAVIIRANEIRSKYGGKIVFFLGRFIYYKGINYLIEAMREIDATLLLAGSGPLESELRNQVEKMSLSGKVFFVGEPDDAELPAYYHACDLFALPSIAPSEAFGIVQIEAHICGKPVVSTNLPTGVTFANKDGLTGFTVPPRNSEALGKAINHLILDDELRLRMGAAAKERAEREFTREMMAKRVLSVYEEVLG